MTRDRNRTGTARGGAPRPGGARPGTAPGTRRAPQEDAAPFSPAAEARIRTQVLGDRRHGL
ncbi:hypothetical protein J0910_16780 [Nocardiopsis sp. CNT-189]|uniref:hypothetical protein n=1 Tax=Nocardiopsis oceanisediminis TaxID=2816862 RepID=UPI003B375A0A